MQLGTMLYVASTWVLPVLLAVTLHEAAHGFVAHLLGDDTAYRLGRVSFNPLKHIDPFGTILMPAILLFLRSPFLFGYAKPVPVNFRRAEPPAPRHGSCRRRRAGHKYRAGYTRGPSITYRFILAAWRRVIGGAKPGERSGHQRGSRRVQHVAASTARWGSGCRRPPS